MSASILIADDEPAQRQFLRAVLERDYQLVTVADGEEARQLLAKRTFDLVLTDDRMPRMTGMELIDWAREHTPETPVIVLTAYGSIETAVEAIKHGAVEYLTKPLKSPDELRLLVAKVLGQRRLRDRTLAHEVATESEYPRDIVAQDPEMRAVLELARRVAPEPTTVLLTGESGTGKEVVARFIHRASSRAEGAFVAVNCAALTETLLESDLFGHVKGAYTGASADRRGRFELAHEGTLFLDEVAEMGINLQAKLLRVLEERELERVGGSRTIRVDVRVLAATNREPEQAVGDGILRPDLYYRLNVFPIRLPALRQRRQDVLPLAEHFVRKLAARMGRQPLELSPQARARIAAYDWPGNVRELSNAIERALIVCTADEIRAEDLPLPAVTPIEAQAGTPLALAAEPQSLAEIEKAAILAALERNRGDRRRTAGELGISLRTLQYRLRDYGLSQRDG